MLRLTGELFDRCRKIEALTHAMVRLHTCCLHMVAGLARTLVLIQFSSRVAEQTLPSEFIHARFLVVPNGTRCSELFGLRDLIRLLQQIHAELLSETIVVARIGQLKPTPAVVLHVGFSLDGTPRRLVVLTC